MSISNIEIYPNEYEVEKDGWEFPEGDNSLSEALEKLNQVDHLIANHSYLIAKYDARINSQPFVRRKRLSFEDVSHISKNKTVDEMEKSIKKKIEADYDQQN